MIGWIISFIILAFIAALFGFGIVASAAVGIAKLLFWVFIIALVISVVVHFTRRVA